MSDFRQLKDILDASIADFKQYFSLRDFNLALLLFVSFIIEVSRIKFAPAFSLPHYEVMFEVGAGLLTWPLASLVTVDIILARKSRDLVLPKESLFNNTLTFLLTSIVSTGITCVGAVFFLVPGLIALVLLSMAPFIAVYEEGEGFYPLRRSIDLIGRQNFIIVMLGLLFLLAMQIIANAIPYSDNLYLSFFIGILKAAFFPVNIAFSSFLMINLYQRLREKQLANMVNSEEYV